jgi:hypothetical protein
MASARYELRKTASGWTVWDPAKGTPIVAIPIFIVLANRVVHENAEAIQQSFGR